MEEDRTEKAKASSFLAMAQVRASLSAQVRRRYSLPYLAEGWENWMQSGTSLEGVFILLPLLCLMAA